MTKSIFQKATQQTHLRDTQIMPPTQFEKSIGRRVDSEGNPVRADIANPTSQPILLPHLQDPQNIKENKKKKLKPRIA